MGDIELFTRAVAVGFGATLFLDLCGVMLHYFLRFPAPNFCPIGRWVLHMRDGRFVHPGIAKAAPKRGECAAGWIAHYAIGAIFALAFVALVSPRWLQAPNLAPALAFGVVTVVMPWFVLHPAFGLGIAASKSPDPWIARGRSLLNHALFGIGLYVAGRLATFAGGA